jgi:ubiquinone biosynthesis protein COQ4
MSIYGLSTESRVASVMTTQSAVPPAVFMHADRKKPKFRPFKALRHFRNLIADK